MGTAQSALSVPKRESGEKHTLMTFAWSSISLSSPAFFALSRIRFLSSSILASCLIDSPNRTNLPF